MSEHMASRKNVDIATSPRQRAAAEPAALCAQTPHEDTRAPTARSMRAPREEQEQRTQAAMHDRRAGESMRLEYVWGPAPLGTLKRGSDISHLRSMGVPPVELAHRWAAVPATLQASASERCPACLICVGRTCQVPGRRTRERRGVAQGVARVGL